MPVLQNVPVDVLQAALRQSTEDESATLTDVEIVPMQHVGWGGNDLFRTEVTWTGREGTTSTDWVVKHWCPGGGTCVPMGVSLPLEALAWQRGLLGPEWMPDGLRVPYVNVSVDDASGSAWIVMEDITDALQAASTPGTPDEQFERAKVVIDRLARWHVDWEQPDRQAILATCPWLVQQDSRLWWGADHFAAALGIKPRHPERVLNPPDPAMREMSRRCVRVFWDTLTEAQRRVWKKHLVDRDDLVAACADLPRTLIHGDCGVLNTGLRMGGERTELLLIDWEWTAVASPAFDVWYYAISVFPVHAGNMRSALCAYYYDRYLAHGGTAMDEVTWERACALASIFEGLKAFPLFAGAAFCEGSPFYDPSEHETVKACAAQYTETMRAWLGR